jgi:hypothetical protein
MGFSRRVFYWRVFSWDTFLASGYMRFMGTWDLVGGYDMIVPFLLLVL